MYRCVLFFLFLFPGLTFAQNAKDILEKAEAFFANEKYTDALKHFQEYQSLKKADEEILLKLGICYYETNQLDYALTLLNDLLRRKPESQTYLYLGKVYQAKQQYEQAIEQYKEYLRVEQDNQPSRAAIKDMIKRCGQGVSLVHKEKLAIVENIGSPVNTQQDEIAPLPSPNYEARLYFASNRKNSKGGLRDEKGFKDEQFGNYKTDMFYADVIDGSWTRPEQLSSLLNSAFNDIVLGFTNGGTVIYFFRGHQRFSGNILVDTFQQNEDWALKSADLQAPFFPEKGDVDLYFFNDSVMVFSSRSLEGYGGSDLFISTRQGKGWTKPQNLGPAINTAYDERTPFLAANGKILFYSTNHPRKSMGGLDILKATFDTEKSSWKTPENLGIPINSGGDDLYFRLTADGVRAYFSSDRKEGYGGYDIYTAFFKSVQNYQLTPSEPFVMISSDDSEQQEVLVEEETTDQAERKEEVEVLSVPLLNYRDEDDLLSIMNQGKLVPAIKLLNSENDIQTTIICHSDDEENPDKYDLYFAVKRSEKVAEYMVSKGVEPQQLTVTGVGSNYPIALQELNGNPNPTGAKLNRRLELLGGNGQKNDLLLQPEVPKVSAFMATPQGAGFLEVSKGLSYRILITEASGVYNDDNYTALPDAMVEKGFTEKNYRYTAGLFKTFDPAFSYCKELVEIGYREARVVPYLNGVKIQEDDIAPLLTNYPDLLKYVAAYKG